MTTTDMSDVAAQGRPAPVVATPEVLDGLSGVPRLVRFSLRMLLNIQSGSLTVRLPDQAPLRFEGKEPGDQGEVELKHYRAVRRLLAGGGIGFGEAYIAGDVDSPDMAKFLEVFARNRTMMLQALRMGLFDWVNKLYHKLHKNTRKGSERNIHAHYDLGNEFYGLWLDPTMTYSSAIFKPGMNDLASAQREKYRALADSMQLEASHHVLEIGCGWGGFAEYAAGEIGCRVTGITISKEQLEFARERVQRAGLSDKVEIRYQDYRDVSETFDRVASIEMFEAVGEDYWPTYFQQVRNVLKPGGKAGLQIITIADEAYEDYRNTADFIQRYIFPGGMLPSPTALRDQISNAGLVLTGNREFGRDYARTLRMWQESFAEAWPKIEPLGFDERFKRLWHFYLAYCEAGFSSANTDVTQVTLARA
ncbi:Cyclopropane-fatty-acyl-phospholipid synthase, plant type [Candidatus Phaeomarinobacter ectocarpi]|uniref:Cyclopropane-fatty-acyl-phospholipid synthase, plant type n=1 Tax=Candidatus Phaeomarinibacter ectocarpi TaxID=1458461 RepID=X5MF04_9HYPH|nr:cyclopropane-fatty-acyl-phospholipid synthase family protein [Candidatus Phaeomarinobacter ectocarpi]CDO61252.1 Cyclopropane-fatty-acyl-phospholipid synthase, plant type [Candidatus Phaeomarinobacter ectocarpi]